MLDIQFIRDNPDLIRYAAERRGLRLDLQTLITADDERKRLSLSVQGKKARSRVLERLVEQGDSSAQSALNDIQKEISTEEQLYTEALHTFKREMIHIPNLPDISVPTGDATQKRVEVARSEAPFPQQSTLSSALAGVIQTVTRGENTWLIPEAATAHAYTTFETYIRRSLVSAGFLHTRAIAGTTKDACIVSGAQPEEVATFLSDVSLGLVGSSTAPYLFEPRVGENSALSDLPKKYSLETTLFRPEPPRTLATVLGALVVSQPRHDTSVEQHEALRQYFESLCTKLQLPYKTSVCTAQSAHPSTVKSYVLSLPWVDDYPVVTINYYHDFQSRRAGIKCTDTDGKVRFAHTCVADGLCLEELFALVYTVHKDGTQSFLDSLVS